MPATPLIIGGQKIGRGESKDIYIDISETYTGDKIRIPLRVINANKSGPKIFVTAAIHGDEINGTGIIHDFLFGEEVTINKGTLILVPVVNVFGFEAHERYLPDRRDLNRSFPGSPSGSLASRIANTLMKEIVDKCDYGLDLHTAASQRTNYPNIRADLTDPSAKRLASAFGCALVVDGKGPIGSFRREATKRGCPTIILEAGEPGKIEPSVLQIGMQGIRNVLIDLDMIQEKQSKAPYQAYIRKSTWLRATVGGILKFHVSPGDFIDAGQAIATNYSILGAEQNTLTSEFSGIILGMTTMPAVKPGEPICNIAQVPQKQLNQFRKRLKIADDDSHEQARIDLATNIDVIDTVLLQ
ncbi:succinylglutamate desuccinylase/aspartoacylase family protein [Puniceicoccaceae bacterium K14]|nr:succinylglutamate desuccinylase/aspartoacylase family protein [Puniceicoccaceae bacterium K14]